jgi:hypothetical protein
MVIGFHSFWATTIRSGAEALHIFGIAEQIRRAFHAAAEVFDQVEGAGRFCASPTADMIPQGFTNYLGFTHAQLVGEGLQFSIQPVGQFEADGLHSGMVFHLSPPVI